MIRWLRRLFTRHQWITAPADGIRQCTRCGEVQEREDGPWIVMKKGNGKC